MLKCLSFLSLFLFPLQTTPTSWFRARGISYVSQRKATAKKSTRQSASERASPKLCEHKCLQTTWQTLWFFTCFQSCAKTELSNSAEHRSVGGLLSWSWSLCSYSAKMNVCSFLQPWTRRRWNVLQEMMLSGSQVCRQAYDMCALNCLRLSVMWKSLSGKDLKVKPKSIFMIWDFLQQWLGQPLPSVASTVLASDVLRHTGTVFYHTRSCRQWCVWPGVRARST